MFTRQYISTKPNKHSLDDCTIIIVQLHHHHRAIALS